MNEKRKLILRYQKFIEKTDSLTVSLGKMHNQHMQCRLGCDFCCMEYSVFPIEFYTILENLQNMEISLNNNAGTEDCIFLVNHACTIYGFRPMICRTHGLPLLYMNDVGEWELSACELNFTDFEEDFHSENTFPQDRFNSKLFMLNKEFIALEEYSHFSEFDLIPLRELKRFFDFQDNRSETNNL
jgi:uncharacterized protein